MMRACCSSSGNWSTFLYDGNAVKKSYEQAFQWCYKFAEQNYPSAQAFVGLMYASGDGVKEDKEKAVKWYRKGANLGSGTAQYSLGNRYTAKKQYDISYALSNLAMENGEKELAEAERNMGLKEMSEREIDAGKLLAEELRKSNNLLRALDEYEFAHCRKREGKQMNP